MRVTPDGRLDGEGPLLFDHDQIVATAVEALRERYEIRYRYVDIHPDPDGFLPEPFTLHQLRKVHEAVVGAELHKDNFNRRMKPLPRAADPQAASRCSPTACAAGRPPCTAADKLWSDRRRDVWSRIGAPAQRRSRPLRVSPGINRVRMVASGTSPLSGAGMPKEHEPLSKVIDDKTFVVADYQRPYAWTHKQLADIWGDLDLLGNGEHYAGTLVLRETGIQKTTSSGEALREYEVVDGQQRLTTITILLGRLLSALESLVTVTDADLSEGVEEAKPQIRRLVRINLGGVTEPRLQLGTDLANFWRDHVVGSMTAPSDRLAAEQRLLDAVEFFDAQIASIVDPANTDLSARRLLDLRRRVTFGLKLLVYEVGTAAEVGVIFETLNDRGRSLTQLEKIKNYLLYLAAQLTDARGPKLAHFIDVGGLSKNLADLPAESEDRLLRAHWLATQNADRRTWKGVDAIKQKFPRTKYVPSSQKLDASVVTTPTDTDAVWQDLFDDVSDYVDKLWQCSEFLKDLEDPDPKYAVWSADPVATDRARRNSKALARSGVVAQFLPLLFAVRLSRPKDASSYADVLAACETFSARVFAICVRRAGAGQSALAGLANRLFHGFVAVEDVIADIGKLTWEYAPDELVRSNFQTSTELVREDLPQVRALRIRTLPREISRCPRSVLNVQQGIPEDYRARPAAESQGRQSVGRLSRPGAPCQADALARQSRIDDGQLFLRAEGVHRQARNARSDDPRVLLPLSPQQRARDRRLGLLDASHD